MHLIHVDTLYTAIRLLYYYRAPATTQRLVASNMRSNMRPHMPQGHTTRAVPYHQATSSEQHATRPYHKGRAIPQGHFERATCRHTSPLLASNVRPTVHNDRTGITRGSPGDHLGKDRGHAHDQAHDQGHAHDQVHDQGHDQGHDRVRRAHHGYAL